MKKVMLMVLAMVVFSGCGVLDDITCEPDNSPRRFVHHVDYGNCPNMDSLEGAQYSFEGINQDSCGIFEFVEVQPIEGTDCVMRSEYEGYLGEDGPTGVYGTFTFKCPQSQCFVVTEINVY